MTAGRLARRRSAPLAVALAALALAPGAAGATAPTPPGGASAAPGAPAATAPAPGGGAVAPPGGDGGPPAAARPCADAGLRLGLQAWRPAVRAAVAYSRRRAGSVSFAVETRCGGYGHRPLRPARTASVVKAMLLVAYLRRVGPRRALGRGDMRLLAPMVRESDNATATKVRDIVGTRALVALARRARMRCFRAHQLWGLSRTCARDQARFFLDLDAFVPAPHRRTAMRLLRTIVPWQRWGVGRVPRPGWALYFKGGWGSGTGAVSHQVALLERGRRRLALAILTTDNPSHAYAAATLRGVAARLLRGLGPRSAPR